MINFLWSGCTSFEELGVIKHRATVLEPPCKFPDKLTLSNLGGIIANYPWINSTNNSNIHLLLISGA